MDPLAIARLFHWQIALAQAMLTDQGGFIGESPRLNARLNCSQSRVSDITACLFTNLRCDGLAVIRSRRYSFDDILNSKIDVHKDEQISGNSGPRSVSIHKQQAAWLHCLAYDP